MSFLAAVWAVAVGVAAYAATELTTAVVEDRSVPREYRLDGVAEAVNRGTISAQTQGEVREILYDVDDVVEEGNLLIRLKNTEHQARVEQAREDHDRVKGLFKKKGVSRSAMDAAEADLKAAQGSQEAAIAGLEQAQEQLEYTQVKAPYSGIVTTRHVEFGEMARPGTALITGISLSDLRVIVDVPQSVIAAVRELGEANVYVGDKAIEPTKITVSPFADAGSNTFMVRLDLPERTEGLFPGMFVKTGFIIGKKDQLVVPKQAVVYRSEVTGVYAVEDEGHVRFRHIRVGRKLGDALVVLSGLEAGDQVALDPVAAGVTLKKQIKAAHGAGGGDKHDG